MDLFWLVLLFAGWLRLLMRVGLRWQSMIMPSVLLAITSWIVIADTSAFIERSALGVVVVIALAMGIGLIWPGSPAVRFVRQHAWRAR